MSPRAPQFPVAPQNPCGLDGLEFVEFASPEPSRLEQLFTALGFSPTMRLGQGPVDLYQQGDISFLLNREPRSFAASFAKRHGPSIPSIGLRVRDARRALEVAVARGASGWPEGDLRVGSRPVPAIQGIGGSLVYFIDEYASPSTYRRLGFEALPEVPRVADKGFFAIDHLTNNVEKGTLRRWADFYQGVLGFEEVRSFDIRGERTGLTSYALRSPCGRFCIPINEGTEAGSQINEYLEQYRGPGIQHLALATDDLVGSLARLEGSGVETLDVEEGYYRDVFTRVPHVREDHQALARRGVLVDGDEEGYLLQIFTRTLVGPIFLELIQRRNHFSFGEGNFGALFRSIERDQRRRGVLDG